MVRSDIKQTNKQNQPNQQNQLIELKNQFILTQNVLENFAKSNNELDKMYLIILLSSVALIYMIFIK